MCAPLLPVDSRFMLQTTIDEALSRFLDPPKLYEAAMEPQDSRKRNMDRRRETSRFAARDRRAKESDIYDDLKDVVPVVDEPTITHVDRIALLRVAATVCRYRKNVGNALTAAPESAKLLRRRHQIEIQGESPWSEESLTECLDGFILIADSDGVILYVTESVSLFLGLTQTDFAGRHLKDFIATEDFKDYLTCTQELTAEGLEMSRPLVLRIKTVISPRGRNLNLKSAILKPVSFNIRVLVSAAGHCHILQAITVPAGQGTVSSSANAITKQGDSPSGTFMTRHTCDMKLSYVSEQLHMLLKTDSRTLMGSSYYDLVHPSDAERFRESILELLQKGHTRTPYYRLITSEGTVAWIMTEANTVTHTTRGQKGQYIIGIHHLLGQQSEDECHRGACPLNSAGLPVRPIKQEPEDREYLTRQPEILDCVDFTPMMGDAGEFHPVPQLRTRRGLGDLSNGNHFNNENNDATPSRKKSIERMLQFFRDHPERGFLEEEGARREEGGEEQYGGVAGGERQQRGYGVQSVVAAPSCDEFTGVAYRRSSVGSAGSFGQRGVVGGVVGRGGGGMLQGASMQSQQPPSHYHRQLQQPVSSPQNALSSSFSRACDLSSPPHSAAAATTPTGPRAHSPFSVASIERELRSEEFCGLPTEDGRIGTGIPETNAFPLSYSAGRGDIREYPTSQDMLSSLPPAGFSAAQPLNYGVRRGQRVMNSSMVSSGYGSTANSCSPSSSSSTASSTPLQQPHSSAAAAARSMHAAYPYCDVASTDGRMYRDDGFDGLGFNAPFFDDFFDQAIVPPQDLGALLELPPNEADGLPNFYVSPYDLPKVSQVPAKRAVPPQGATLDDYLWRNENPSPFLDGRM